ncbi:MAG: hypothetical protein PSX81_14860 [bacterium]|nr:hypothetical protein [bacterium]
MRTKLQGPRTAKNIKAVAAIAAKDEEAFKELIQLMMDNKDKEMAFLATWTISHVAEKNKVIPMPYMAKFIKRILDTDSDGIKRCIVKVWQLIKIPTMYHWEVADICFNFLKSPKEAVAIKAFSITVLQHLMKDLPELKNEVIFELEKQLPHAQAGFKVRAIGFLKLYN